MIGLWYNAEILDIDATPWIANMQAVELGSHAPLTDEQRQEVIRIAEELDKRG